MIKRPDEINASNKEQLTSKKYALPNHLMK